MEVYFKLYYDSLNVIEEMTDEQVGKLLRKMRSYHNGNNYKSDDKVVDIAFIQFKNQFDRDKLCYKQKCDKNAENIKKRWNKNNTNEYERIQSNTNEYELYQEKEKEKEKEKKNNKDKDKVNIEIYKINNNDSIEIKLQKTLGLFLEYRKELKKPIKETSKDAFIKNLTKLSGNNPEIAIEILNESMANGRQGIFELKQTKTNTDLFPNYT